jgi:structure-specific recognition protein 1
MKAVQGELYFLEKSIFFLSKQPYLVNFNDVFNVVFTRYEFSDLSESSHPKLFTRLGGGMASAKTLDLRIEPKAGSDVTFSSIGKNEKEYIEEFLAAKKVRVKTEAVDEAMAVDLGSDDEEMQSVASSEDEAPKIRTVGADDDESSEGEWCLHVCQNMFLTDLVSCR